MTYTKITSRYPHLNQPESSEPRMRPQELPNKPKFVDRGVGKVTSTDDTTIHQPMKRLKKGSRIKEMNTGQPVRRDARLKNLKDIIATYNKNPGMKYPSA